MVSSWVDTYQYIVTYITRATMPRSRECSSSSSSSTAAAAAVVEAISSRNMGEAKRLIDKLTEPGTTSGCVSVKSPSSSVLRTAVLAASSLSEPGLMQYLLQRGAPIDFMGETRRVVSGGCVSPVHVAVSSGAHDVLEVLLDARADVHQPDSHARNTPLHIAAAKCDPVSSRMLLHHGACVSALNASGQTALQIVSHYGHVELVRMLLGAGAEVYFPGQRGPSPMHIAASQGHVPLLDLFSHSADVNIRVNCHGREQTPLHLAAREAQLETMCFLLDKLGANVNALDSSHRTPLHTLLAVTYNAKRGVRSKQDHVTGCEALLARNVNVNQRDVNAQTVLHLAARNRFPAAVQVLFLFGVDASVVDEFGKVAKEYVPEQDVETKQMFEKYASFSYLHLTPPAYEETEAATGNIRPEGNIDTNSETGDNQLYSDRQNQAAKKHTEVGTTANDAQQIRQTSSPNALHSSATKCSDTSNCDANEKKKKNKEHTNGNNTTSLKTTTTTESEQNGKTSTSGGENNNMSTGTSTAGQDNSITVRTPSSGKASTLLREKVTVKQRIVLNDGRVIYHTMPKSS